MDLKLQPSDYIAGISAIGAALAAFFAWMSAKQSKRQADAVLGDVAPSFGAYQKPSIEHAILASLDIEIINHNRRALLIDSITLEYPETVIIFTDSDDTKTMIGSIIDGMKKGPRTQTFQIPYRIRGSGMNSEPTPLVLPFKCGWKQGERREPIDFYFRVEYRLDGHTNSTSAFGGVRIVPPKTS